ncbi:MAG: LamG domain-containing protein, partial [Planctomycetes bacterium]|nr:LamG domain-containing protein [Planctomycetota bacterium]
MGQVEGFFSLNGGGQWFPAKATTDTITHSLSLSSALAFDGVDDYVAVPNSSSLDIGTNNLTLEAWVKLMKRPDQITGTFAAIYDSTADSYVIYEDKANNELRFKITDADGTAERPGIPGTRILTGTWHHIAGVYDGDAGTAKIYLDGTLIDTHTNVNLTGLVKSGQVASLGSQAGISYFFNGSIDEVRIYNRALTTDEIKEQFCIGANKLYNSGAINQSTYDSYNC